MVLAHLSGAHIATFVVRFVTILLGILMIVDHTYTLEGTVPVTYTDGTAKTAKVVFSDGYRKQAIKVTCGTQSNTADWDHDHFGTDPDGHSAWVAFVILGVLYIVYYIWVLGWGKAKTGTYLDSKGRPHDKGMKRDDLIIRVEYTLDLILGALGVAIGHHFIPESLANAIADAKLHNSTLAVAANTAANGLAGYTTGGPPVALSTITDEYATGYYLIYAAGIISFVHCLLVFPLKIFHTRDLVDPEQKHPRKYYNLGIFPTTGYKGEPPATKPFILADHDGGIETGIRLTDGKRMTPMPTMC